MDKGSLSKTMNQQAGLGAANDMSAQERDLMIRELAKAYIDDPFTIQPFGATLEFGIRIYEGKSDEQLVEEYNLLKQSDLSHPPQELKP